MPERVGMLALTEDEYDRVLRWLDSRGVDSDITRLGGGRVTVWFTAFPGWEEYMDAQGVEV